MFAGAGEFFRPVALRREISPASAVPATARSGEEQGKPSFAQSFTPPVPPPEEPPAAASDGAAPDSLELTIAALHAMLTGRAPESTDAGALPPDTPSVNAAGLAAYQRAAAAAPRASGPLGEGMRTELAERARAVPPSAAGGTDGAAGADIFYMLAALENAGVQAVRVGEGDTIYSALRMACRARDIALAAPAQRPDNPQSGF